MDSRFCLLEADMKETNSMPKQLILDMRRQRCMQVWLHHKGRNGSTGAYGDKTAEWLIDSNIELQRHADESTSLVWEKKRNEEPANAHMFTNIDIEMDKGVWIVKGTVTKKPTKGTTFKDFVMSAIEELAQAAHQARQSRNGKIDASAITIDRGAIRDRMVKRGDIEIDPSTKQITEADKRQIRRALSGLRSEGKIETNDTAVTLKI